jgi:hypothetical protein
VVRLAKSLCFFDKVLQKLTTIQKQMILGLRSSVHAIPIPTMHCVACHLKGLDDGINRSLMGKAPNAICRYTIFICYSQLQCDEVAPKKQKI